MLYNKQEYTMMADASIKAITHDDTTILQGWSIFTITDLNQIISRPRYRSRKNKTFSCYYFQLLQIYELSISDTPETSVCLILFMHFC